MKRVLVFAGAVLLIAIGIAIVNALSKNTPEYRAGKAYIYNSNDLEKELGHIGKVYFLESSKYTTMISADSCRLYFLVETHDGEVPVEIEMVRAKSHTSNDPKWVITSHRAFP